MVDLDKNAPAELVSLAKSARTTIQKHGLDGHVAAVSLVFDRSGSMSPLFRDGMVQRLIERVMGLALNFDDNGAIDIFAFGQNAHTLGEFAAAQFAVAVEQILQRTGFEGETRYAPLLSWHSGTMESVRLAAFWLASFEQNPRLLHLRGIRCT